jgi:hypothetical protein
MQRQELNLKGARGHDTALADLPVPAKYRWVPEGVPPDSRYNVAQLYVRLAGGFEMANLSARDSMLPSLVIACLTRSCVLRRPV